MKPDMNFRTTVSLPEKSINLTPESKVMFIGSCFADHIGEKMSECLPENQRMVNPNGVIYNPESMRRVVSSLMAETDEINADDGIFLAADGLCHHWDYSTLYYARTREELSSLLKERRSSARLLLSNADVLFLTFSTDHAYRLNSGLRQGTVVANCHKAPAKCFTETILNEEEQRRLWLETLVRLHSFNPKLKVVFTLSPYRYAKYGMHENALSKARLLCLADALCRESAQASYFPAYEIVTDELRDYRFYAADMLHPSEQAVDYVWERFTEWCFSPQLSQYADERRKLLREYRHRPTHTESEAYAVFQRQRDEKRRTFEAKWDTALF